MKIKRKYWIICGCIVFAILVSVYIVNENQSRTVVTNQIKQLPLMSILIQIFIMSN